MSTQITRKSTGDSQNTAAAAPDGTLLDVLGKPVPPAPTLASARRPAYAPSHGRAAEPLPAPPSGLFDLGAAHAFRVRGPDRETWLQGMQTADLRAAPYGGAVYGAFLGGKGRLVSDGLLWRFPEEVVVTVPEGRAAPLLAHLDRLLIMEDAELAPAQGLRRLRWYPAESLESLPAASDAARLTGSWQGLGLELLVPEAAAQELLAALPERPDPAHVERHRVALGVPEWGKDLDEETVPLEGGLDRAVSFEKGCYVGQEVVAMATFRGRVLWNLVRLQVAGAPPERRSLLDPARAGKRGRVTSAAALPGGAQSALLGYVHKELMEPGSKVALEDGRAAEVLGLPFEARPGAGVCV
jgi:folate-binding protein YgfZ